MHSEQGIFGLALLQKALSEQEEHTAEASSADGSIQTVKAVMAQTLLKEGKRPKLGQGIAEAAAAKQQQLLQRQQQQFAYWDDDEDERDEDEQQPEFAVTIDQDRAEFIDFNQGSSSLPDNQDAFGLSGWDQFNDFHEEQDREEDEVQLTTQQQQRGLQLPTKGESDDDMEVLLLQDLGNEDDWGLEGLVRNSASKRQHKSLVNQLVAREYEADGLDQDSLAASSSTSVQWGGSAGTTGIDLEEQEELLRRYFTPDKVKKLIKDQIEIDASYSEQRKRVIGLGTSDRKTQEKLRIVAGSAAGRKLVSFRSTQTRPMMEKVRQAIFNMIQSQAGSVNCLPRTARWLDLFAGTGSVGIEAMSRGIKEAHFVEMDPIVVQKILCRNITSCGFKNKATCHTTKAEDFLQRAAKLPRFAGGSFDFISVCPPYLLVSYPVLFDLLDVSPLIHPGSIVFVEYPKQLAHEVLDTMGPLRKVRDRKYGRTYVAVYAQGSSFGKEVYEIDPFLSGQV
eukprot:GHRR01012086.1.p1 GENE.GHRR01012086.1~~GHRR01012086.1.p1  ORF type:complete len:507 (+),score=153.42 GHRR01012086.1:580-2100(+)